MTSNLNFSCGQGVKHEKLLGLKILTPVADRSTIAYVVSPPLCLYISRVYYINAKSFMPKMKSQTLIFNLDGCNIDIIGIRKNESVQVEIAGNRSAH